jgi:carboxyl-terminal processing protease
LIRNSRIRLIALLLIVIFVSSSCVHLRFRSDPDRYLMFDALSLIDDFYIEPVNYKGLFVQSFRGIAVELAVRIVKAEQEAEKKKKEEEAAGEPPAEEVSPTPEQPEAEKNPTTEGEDPKPEKKKRQTIEDLIARAPFTMSEDPFGLLLTANGQEIKLTYPLDKQQLVDAFFSGLKFLQKQLELEVTDKKPLWSAINQMVQSLDPHSSFLDPELYARLREETRGAFAGVGIEVGIRRDKLTVISPLEGTPAFKAGLLPMDHIKAIDGTLTAGISLFEAVEKIRGEVGTPVVLTMERVGKDDPFDVTLVRAKIEERSTKHELFPGKVGWLRLYKFNEHTTEDLEAALTDLQEKSGGLRCLVLDLRYNPGGLLEQAVNVADRFLDSGLIVNTMGRGMFDDRRHFANARGTERELPMIVIINVGSASGSEIVAGALQDRNRALLIGTKSFGKGSVQSIFKLPGDSGLKLTTAQYYTPSGRSIQATGIVPDIAFSYPEEEELRSEYSEQALKNHVTTTRSDPDAEADFVFDAETLFEHYKANGTITIDPDYPEKSDWMLVLSGQIAAGDDLSTEAMLDRAIQLLKQVPPLEKAEEPDEPEIDGDDVGIIMLPPDPVPEPIPAP